MRLHFATIPVFGDGAAEEELNRFLAAHRVLSVERQLVSAGEMSAWAVCVTYVEGEPVAPLTSTKRGAARIDYRDRRHRARGKKEMDSGVLVGKGDTEPDVRRSSANLGYSLWP